MSFLVSLAVSRHGDPKGTTPGTLVQVHRDVAVVLTAQPHAVQTLG